jgi:hypothetical protein
VGVDGAAAEEEAASDLGVGQAFGGEPDHLDLALAQPERGRLGRRGGGSPLAHATEDRGRLAHRGLPRERAAFEAGSFELGAIHPLAQARDETGMVGAPIARHDADLVTERLAGPE